MGRCLLWLYRRQGCPIVHAFKERVKAGVYPTGQRDGRGDYWLRDDLDRAIEDMMGKTASSPHKRKGWGERFGDLANSTH